LFFMINWKKFSHNNFWLIFTYKEFYFLEKNNLNINSIQYTIRGMGKFKSNL